MQIHNICGYCASILFTASLIPQIVRVLKLKRSDQISIYFVIYSIVACSLMLIYSYVEGAWPVLLNNVGCLFLNMVLAGSCVMYRVPQLENSQEQL